MNAAVLVPTPTIGGTLEGAILGTAWLALRGKGRATPIPFGPFLAAGGWLQLLYGDELFDWYARLLG